MNAGCINTSEGGRAMRYHYCPKCRGVLQASDDLTDVGFFTFEDISELAFPTDEIVIRPLKEDGLLK
jgi:hypothetical protein